MKGSPGTLALVCAVALVAAPAAGAQALDGGLALDGYRERVERICKSDTERSKRILAGAQQRLRKGKLAPAGRQFLRVSQAFGGAIRQIVKVPRPPADDVRLRKWSKFLRILMGRLRELGKVLVEERRVKANHASIRAERSGNAANNVSFPYEFTYCRITRSRFR